MQASSETIPAQSVSIPTPAGMLAALYWTRSTQPSRTRPCYLALHGWLDNAESFHRIAPLLAEDADVLAIDLPGHGLSDHRPPGSSYHVVDNVQTLDVVVDWLTDAASSGFPFSCAQPEDDNEHAAPARPLYLLGHSLGGVISLTYAAVAAERLSGLICIEALGPLSGPAEETSSQLRKYLMKERKRRSSGSERPVYSSIEAVCKARMLGFGGLSESAAEALVTRALKPCDEGWTWRSDPRLRLPSSQRMTEAQVIDLLKNQTLPTLLIATSKGFISADESSNARLRVLRETLETGPGFLQVVTVEGNHHGHLDGDYSAMALHIQDFLKHSRSIT
ncbi:alpha/beta hydrolase [Allohahella marinimesophila]|uniref:Alpha/beta hydrolase n=1 Tax=Allohahella marinimesophila TaxID=1054972 RepID=A0ABP7NVN0_9GAMM